MDYTNLLKNQSSITGSIACVGFDPVLERIPIKSNAEGAITKFFSNILDAFSSEQLPGAIKPNMAFYEQYGFEGLRALKSIIKRIKELKIPLILDAKRGDIGSTGQAYAKSIFEFWEADATTLSPYMGEDSIKPFIEWTTRGKGAYVLNRTSNPGAHDFQDIVANMRPLFLSVSERLVSWHKPGLGAVVGATRLEELGMISEYFSQSTKEIPLLIPGVGAQGGSASDTANLLRSVYGDDIRMHRINSSSGIIYSHESGDRDDYAECALNALKKLNKEIGKVK